jgi:hypothetical protein
MDFFNEQKLSPNKGPPSYEIFYQETTFRENATMLATGCLVDLIAKGKIV